MKVKLIICILNDVEEQLTLHDIADLTKSMDIEYVGDNADFIIRMVSSVGDLLNVVEQQLYFTKKTSCLVISDQLIINDANKQNPKPSDTTNRILESVKHSNSVCPLIALSLDQTPHVQGIDANVVLSKNWKLKLRKELEKITQRLWYKKPPSNILHHNNEQIFSIEITTIPDQNTLRKSLELRGHVYQALGYIEHSSEKAMIEMDSYDLTSIHFHALDRANHNRLAGSMRLIIPGMSQISMAPHHSLLSDYKNWCLNIARASEDRQWWKIIERGSQTALPVLGAFDFFSIPDQTLKIDASIMPRNICELSRVVVAPEYRGMGISKLLVNHAISVAKQLCRKYLWIECAPHHINMYKKYDFIVKDHQGEHFYQRAQRLDTWAVAMFLRLSDIQDQKLLTNSICYRLQIPELSTGNCSLLFQFVQKTANEIEKIFNSPIKDGQISKQMGVRNTLKPLKKLFLSTLKSHDVNNFIYCLKQLVTYVKVERLSLQHSSGSSFDIYPQDINSINRKAIESKLIQWLR